MTLYAVFEGTSHTADPIPRNRPRGPSFCKMTLMPCKIYKGEGIKGIYRGVGAAMIRTSFGSAVQLPTYFFAKRRLTRHLGMEEGPALHLASSAASGFVVCCFMHPPGMLSRTRAICSWLTSP